MSQPVPFKLDTLLVIDDGDELSPQASEYQNKLFNILRKFSRNTSPPFGFKCKLSFAKCSSIILPLSWYLKPFSLHSRETHLVICEIKTEVKNEGTNFN